MYSKNLANTDYSYFYLIPSELVEFEAKEQGKGSGFAKALEEAKVYEDADMHPFFAYFEDEERLVVFTKETFNRKMLN